MHLLYFAHARRITGLSEETIPVTAALTSGELWDLLAQRYPDIAPLRPSSRLARNNEFLPANARIEPHDEIAIIPPVSGG